MEDFLNRKKTANNLYERVSRKWIKIKLMINLWSRAQVCLPCEKHSFGSKPPLPYHLARWPSSCRPYCWGQPWCLCQIPFKNVYFLMLNNIRSFAFICFIYRCLSIDWALSVTFSLYVRPSFIFSIKHISLLLLDILHPVEALGDYNDNARGDGVAGADVGVVIHKTSLQCRIESYFYHGKH